MGDSVADSVTNRTEFEGLAGVEFCGPGQGKLMLLILKFSESRNIQIHKCSPLGVLYERRIQTEPFPTCWLLLLVPRTLQVYDCSTGIANHLTTPFNKRDKVH